jgi:hypothetical protein
MHCHLLYQYRLCGDESQSNQGVVLNMLSFQSNHIVSALDREIVSMSTCIGLMVDRADLTDCRSCQDFGVHAGGYLTAKLYQEHWQGFNPLRGFVICGISYLPGHSTLSDWLICTFASTQSRARHMAKRDDISLHVNVLSGSDRRLEQRRLSVMKSIELVQVGKRGLGGLCHLYLHIWSTSSLSRTQRCLGSAAITTTANR